MGHVYGLRLRGSDNIRYVGKTIGTAEKRLKSHFKCARRGDKRPLYDWMRKYGLDQIEFVILDENDEPSVLSTLEVKWISDLREKGYSLLNLTDGGEGTPGWVPPPEWIEKVRAQVVGRRHSEETKQLMRERSTGKKHSPEVREKLKRAWTDERKKVASAKLQELRPTYVYTDESRRKQGEAAKKNNHQRWHVNRDIINPKCVLCAP